MSDQTDHPTPDIHVLVRLSDSDDVDRYYIPRELIETVLKEAGYKTDHDKVDHEWTYTEYSGGDSLYLGEVVSGCGSSLPSEVIDAVYDTISVKYDDGITVSILQSRGEASTYRDLHPARAQKHDEMFRELLTLAHSSTVGHNLDVIHEMWQHRGLTLTPEELVELRAQGDDFRESVQQYRGFTRELYNNAYKRTKELEKTTSKGLER